MIISFSQRDPQWSEKLIPGTALTIGRFGCVITTIADISTAFGDNLTPAQVAETIKFTLGGLILWNSCNFRSFKWVRREHRRDDRNIGEALSHPDQAVLLQVANFSHWVLALGFDEVSKRLVIADPWLGDMTSITRYKNNITGASYFKKK